MTRFRDLGRDYVIVSQTDTAYKIEAVDDRSWWGWVPKSWKLEPTARNTDPITSHQAAAMQTPGRVSEVHREVLKALQWGPRSDFELAPIVSKALGRRLIPTSVGCRRKELQRIGLVADSGTKGTSDTGSPCIRWALTHSGQDELKRGAA